MDNKLPYDEEDIRIPDAEASWQKMKALLEEKKRRRVPPFFFSCAGWSLIGVIVIAGGWYVLQSSIWEDKGGTAHVTTGLRKTQPTEQTSLKQKPVIEHTSAESETTKSEQLPSERELLTTDEAILERAIAQNVQPLRNYKKPEVIRKKAQRRKSSRSQLVIDTEPSQNREGITKTDVVERNAVTNDASLSTANAVVAVPTQAITDSTQQSSAEVTAGDSTITQPVDSAKGKKAKAKSLYLTAGLGVQQGIPIAGQGAYPYNYYGRKGSLQDYIPSLYVRLHSDRKWFVQGEFRYGAPQSVKDFSYNRETRYDSSTNSLTTTTLYLKKTYYHQLPLSFNYHVAPKLSVGIGGVYSRFYGAITEEEVRSRNVFSGTENTAKKIVQIPHFNDSFLYKTQLHLLLQTDYQWSRLSVGLRYKKDIQPYIKYTEPDGKVDVRKNQSLEAVIRFQIWKSTKK